MLTKVSAFDSCSGHETSDDIGGFFYFYSIIRAMYFVYILYSPTFDKFYIGQTNDMADRLRRHNAGYESATNPYKPWLLKWMGTKSLRKEAVLLEKKLKKLCKARLHLFIQKYDKEGAGPDEA